MEAEPTMPPLSAERLEETKLLHFDDLRFNTHLCIECHEPWPCDTSRLVAMAQASERLRSALREIMRIDQKAKQQGKHTAYEGYSYTPVSVTIFDVAMTDMFEVAREALSEPVREATG